ncbi:hypothetical protein FGU65_12030 [Methanoculleus sp. FWC-SCC1]|uniref:ATPase of the ABC class C-terminal domain-containing protein n=1 Tax=Methanoculleus frigidifontis TaxID=2584085 RepID=A0ABT8MCL4_9EURY|nr:P-loop domain-containing protein [Methanoculleus sp. FWC-SCC1]MDN7025610.1 hypothetical protein [Methanoculleus sp. FWC-SCC1]
MTRGSWNTPFHAAIPTLGTDRIRVDHAAVRDLVTAYMVRSLDETALRFSLPVLLDGYRPGAGADGAVGVLIEAIKARVHREPGLGSIAGIGTLHPGHCLPNIEPVTVTETAGAIGTNLWRPDNLNRLDDEGLHLVVRGAVPYPGHPSPEAAGEVADLLQALLEAIEQTTGRVPESRLAAARALSADQKDLRQRLPTLGLVAFVGDGVRPARRFTHLRCHHRIAGSKEGVHVPFSCPKELDPVEVELAGSGRVITGLGIRRREVFAVAGSNAEGKSTFLHAVTAGADDHAAGDGREYLVSVPGIARAEASERDLAGADVSLFFKSLPPGIGGTPQAVYGRGSGSVVMAHELQTAVRKQAPLLIFDEDRSATNLLVPGCLQSGDVTPLATLLAARRDLLGETALLFAASSLDVLIARADRILTLDGHRAGAIGTEEFRMRMRRHLAEMLDSLGDGGAEEE